MRDRNRLLLSAGLEPTFPESALGAERMKPLMKIVDRIFARHLPYPAWLVDGTLRVVRMNAAAAKVFPGLGGLSPSEAIDMWFAPGPFRDRVENWQSMLWVAFDALRRDLLRNPGPELQALVERAELHMQDIPRPTTEDDGGLPVICPRFRFGDLSIPTVTTTVRFEHPVDVTAEALRLELMFPADDVGERFFESLGSEG